MTGRLVWASVRHRRARVAVACLAVALGVSLPATIAGLRGAQGKLERELRAYGPNLLVVPRSGRWLGEPSLAVMGRMHGEGRLDAFSTVLVLRAQADGREIAVAGVRFDRARAISPWWTVEGAWPEPPSGALLGVNAAAKLGRRPGDSLALRTGNGAVALRVSGLLGTGGSEDNQVVVDLEVARALAGRPGAVSYVQGRAHESRDLPWLARLLAEAIPDAEVRTPFQVAMAEEAVLGRLQRLLLLVASVVLVASAVGVFTTVASRALERTREVGVLKALGAEERSVMWLFAAEAMGIGAAGGFLGFGLGLLMAEAIAWRVFGALVEPSASACLVSLTVGLAVSLGASLGPLRHAARVEPAAVLRGD